MSKDTAAEFVKKVIDENGNEVPQVTEMTMLQMMQFTLRCGGENADFLAETDDEIIQEMLNTYDKVRIIR